MKNRAILPILLVVAVLFAAAGQVSAQEDQQTNVVLNKVKTLLKARQHAEAISLLEGALRKAPKAHQLWIALGYTYEEAKDLPKALEAFRKAQALKLGLTGVATKIINIEKKLKSEAAPAQTPATPGLSEAQAQARRLFEEAVAEKSLGHFETAFPKFVDCVDLDSAYLSDDQGMIPAALNFYREMAKRDPVSVYYLGAYQHLYGELDEALRLLQRFIRENPGSELVEKANARIKAIEASKKQVADAAKAAADQAKAAIPPKKPPVKLLDPMPTTASGSVASPGSPITPTASEPLRTEPSAAQQLAAAEVADLLAQAQEAREAKKPTLAIKYYSVAASKSESPGLLLDLGDLYLEENPKQGAGAAINAYQKVIQKFPNSPEAKKAKQKVLALQPSDEQRAKEVEEYFLSHGND